jgi:hypothetical protein
LGTGVVTSFGRRYKGEHRTPEAERRSTLPGRNSTQDLLDDAADHMVYSVFQRPFSKPQERTST